MSGIVFLKSIELSTLRDFYQRQLGCELWLEQEDCLIFRSHNFLFGFCRRNAVDKEVMLTFFYESREEVDEMYRLLGAAATTSPEINPKYNIYQFFAADPEGRTLEFQYFADRVTRYRSGDHLLLSRRSIREFTGDAIPDDVLRAVLEMSRFAPTSRNTQSYYFKIIKDRQVLDWLSTVRGSSTAPIGRANTAIAIGSDPAVSARHDQDACIAAYHLILAAWFHGLGTCWIGGMNRDDVKARLSIPLEHYVATVTPLGYPKEKELAVPARKGLDDFIRP